MAYDLELPNGVLLKDIPDNIPDSEIRKRVLKEYPELSEKMSRTLGETGKDVFYGLSKGIGQLAQLPGQIGALTGITPPDETTGLQGFGKKMEEISQREKSPVLQAKEAVRQKKIEEADGFLQEVGTAIKSTITDPTLISSFFFEQVPNLIGTGGFGALAKGGTKLLMAQATEQALAKAGLRGALGGGAIMQGADIGTDTYNQIYAELKKRDPNMSDHEAQGIALAKGRVAAIEAAGISLVSANLPGGASIERALAGRSQKAGSLLKNIFGEALSEGVEEGGGALAKNLATQQVFPETNLMQGVGAAAGLGAVGGALFGGLGGISGSTPPPQNVPLLKAIQAPQEPQAELPIEPTPSAPPPAPPAPPAPPVELAPPAPSAAERAAAMPGFTGAPNVNNQLIDQFGQTREDYNLVIQQEAEARKQLIDEVIKTKYDDNEFKNSIIQKRLIAEIEAGAITAPEQAVPAQAVQQPIQQAPQIPADVAQSIEEQQRLKAIQDAELADTAVKLNKSRTTRKPDQTKGLDYTQAELEQMGFPTKEATVLPPAYTPEKNPDNLGIGNQLISEGGLPYTTKAQAEVARKQIPDMRVVETPDGFVLSPKTDAQLAAEAKSKLGTVSVGKKGFPLSAHEFLVSEGGLNPKVAPDTSLAGSNPKVGNRFLFQTNGLTLDQAGEKLSEAGYLPKDQPYTENDVLELLDKSFKTGAYTPEGYNQIGEMQTEDEKRAYERQQAEEELYVPSYDKFDYAYADDLYNQDFQTVLQIADQAGIDAEAIVEDVAKAMPDGATQAQFEESARQSLIGVINQHYGNESETLKAQKGAVTIATPEELKMLKALKGKTMLQAAKWAVDNAPDAAQKYFAKKALNSIIALEQAGVEFKFEIQDGGSRHKDLYAATGVTDFLWGRNDAEGGPRSTKIAILLNGPPVFKNQDGYPSGLEYRTLLHELLHVATRANTRFLPPNHPVVRELNELFNAVIRQFNIDAKAGTLPPVMHTYYRRHNNVLATPDELLSWGLTDREVMNYLNGIKVGEETVMSKIIRIIREVLGISKPYETAMDRLVRVGDKIVNSDVIELGKQMQFQGYVLRASTAKPKRKPTQQDMFAKRGDGLMRDTLQSRRTGFYFDAKNSPLYMTRTENDVSFPTEAEAKAAIAGNKVASNIMRERDNVKEGDFVGVRQDLNIKSAPLLAIHQGKESLLTSGAGFFSGEVQSYAPYVTLKNVHFKIRQTAREKIAQGVEQKSKMGSADGQYVKAAKPNFDGIELRFNPMREHLFVDAMGRAVKHADEVTVVAKRAFARGNIEYYGEEDVPARAGTAPTKARLMGQGEQNAPAIDPTRRMSQGDQESLFSRHAGFYFDAKASPLYQKRTAEQAKAISPQRADVAIRSTATGQRILDKNVQLRDGQYVGVRQDLNILRSTGVSVLAVHEGKESTHVKGAGFSGGTVIKYAGTATLRNVYFKINQKTREKIATGEDTKSPMGSADGQWVNTSNPSFDGVEFRFNPKREHLFRDVQGRVLKYADEITASGVSVFARGNIEYYGEEDIPARAGNAPTEGVLMKPEGQIMPIADEPKGKISLGQQESLFSQQGFMPTAEEVKGKVKQALQVRAPMNVKAFEGIDADVVNGVQQVFFAPNQTIVDRLEGMKGNFFKTLAQKTVDQFRAIRDVSPIGYQQARLSTATDGALEGILFHGHVFNDGGALNIKQGTKGLVEALAPLGNEVDRFHVWLALNREAQLPESKRTPNIQHLLAKRSQFNRGTIDGKSRAEVYEKVRKDLMAINKSVLQVALSTGTIDKEAYDRFAADAFYVPFYKAMEDGKIESIRSASRLSNQKFSEMLKGGSEKPFGDLMENTLRNWSHILSASMKNQAAVTIVKDSMDMGAVEPNLKPGLEFVDGKVYSIQSGEMIGNGELIQEREDESGNKYPVNFTTQENAGDNLINVQMDGMKTYFKVNDPLLFESVGAINYMNSNGKVTEVLRTFKNVLRFGVTASPIFKANNLIKDSIQSAGVSGIGFNLVKNVMSGLSDSGKGSPIYQSALAGGGIFNYGSTLEGDRSAAIKKLISKGVADGTILDTKEKIQNALSMVWNKYEDLGNKSEAANRIALYKKLMAEGKSHLEASYQARDLMDYSMQGSSGAMRWLTQVVPFLGARATGLYKLGRDGVIPTARVFYNTVTGKEIDQTDAQKAKAFSTVAMTTALASMALYLAFKDDEDFQKREQWDRDYFWWFKVPGTDLAFRIPKPFEIGAIGTLAERTLEQIVDDSAESKLFTDSLGKMVWQTFSLNPTPQFFKPLIDIYANKESFTSAPIETAGMERLSKQERKTDQTSPLAIALGGVSHALSNVLGADSEMSPAQIDYLIRAYLGWFGGTIQVSSQYATMPFNNGVYPDADWTKRLSLGFIQDLPAAQSTYVTSFYHNNQLIQQAYADMRHYAELGESERVKEILEEKGDLIRLQSLYDQKTKVMANIRKQLLRVSDPNNDSMTGEEKKDEINRLKMLISDQAKQAEDIRKSFKK